MQAPEQKPQGVASPPSLRILPWLRATSFTRELSGGLMRLELVGELRPGASPPPEVEILIERGADARAFAPVARTVDRLSAGPGRHGHARLLMSFTFMVPAELLDGAALSLLAARRGRVELSAPVAAPAADSASSRRSARTLASAAAIAGATLLAAPAASLAQGLPSSKPPTTASSRTLPTHRRHRDKKKHATSSSTGAAGTTCTTGVSGTGTGSAGTTPGTGATGSTGTGTTTTTTTPSSPPPLPGSTTSCTSGGSGSGTTPTGSPYPLPPGSAGSGSGKGSGGVGIGSGNGQGSGSSVVNAGAKAGAGAIKPVLGVKHENHKTSNSTSKAGARRQADGGVSPYVPGGAGAAGFPEPNFFSLPGSSGTPWGSGVFENPFTQAQLEKFAELAGKKVDPPKYLIADYRQAANRYHIPWEVLAAINYIETGYGKDLAVSPAGAVGWMQFLPATWAQYGEVVREIELGKDKHAAPAVVDLAPIDALTSLGEAKLRDAMGAAEQKALGSAASARDAEVVEAAASAAGTRVDVDYVKYNVEKLFGRRAVSPATIDGHPNPWNPADAIFSAARMLVADGARKNMAKAVYAYNHADWYVQEVLTVAQKITRDDINQRSKPKVKLAAMRAEAHLLNGISYQWGGGHADDNWLVSTGYDCSGFVSALLHAGGYLSYPVTTETLPGQPGIEYGAGKYVTIYDRTDEPIGQDHVIVNLDGQWWESGGSTTAGGAAMVHRITKMNRTYLQSFNVIMHPRGL